jgi:hypothetical protein
MPTFIPAFVRAVRFADRSNRREVGDAPSPFPVAWADDIHAGSSRREKLLPRANTTVKPTYLSAIVGGARHDEFVELVDGFSTPTVPVGVLGDGQPAAWVKIQTTLKQQG